jgi:hypothetical protein
LLEQKDRGVNIHVGNLERKKEKEDSIAWKQSWEGMGQMLQENLVSKFKVCSIFKPNAPLEIVEDVGKLGKDLTKQAHIVIVDGDGNGLDINKDYSIDKDLNFTAERTSNTNVGFVSLLRRYDKPWMNRRVRSVNL